MSETPQAVVVKTFGGLDEISEEMSEAERRCIEAEFERLRCCWRSGSGSAPMLGGSYADRERLVASHPYRSSCGEVLGCYIHHITPAPLISFPSLSEMRLHLPSGLPRQLEKSLSSCCHQSDALWEALEKFRASVLGQPSQGISGFCPSRQLANVVAGMQELAPLPAQDLCHRHLTVFCHCDGVLVCTACMSIVPTPLCCSRRLLAATGSINPFSLQKQFEASQKTLQEEDK
ncbi:uncharacterized protein LOC135460111 [Zonotrichia leucophrys gambelii]|uniref:uncharacterized protein LOC135460111 n=1 Tax=Zonotrichia leucophrys gambelii TaxID=257770 RepID=UPI0031403429